MRNILVYRLHRKVLQFRFLAAIGLHIVVLLNSLKTMSLQRIFARRRRVLRKAGGIEGAYPRKGFGSRSTLSVARTVQSQFSNTFQLEPDNRSRFHPQCLETIMKDILEQRLSDRVYDAKTCSALSQELATAIKVRAKEFKWDRYKLIVDVIIGQNLGQCIEVASRFVWDTETDSYACASFKNRSLFSVASCYGVYME